MAVNFIADLHCHTSMKPFHSGEENHKANLWKEFGKAGTCQKIPAIIREIPAIAEMDNFSQSCLKQCQDGGVRLLFNSLYPVELPWFEKFVYMDQGIEALLRKFTMSWLDFITCLSCFDKPFTDKYFVSLIGPNPPYNYSFNYYERLIMEYDYLIDQSALTVDGWKIQILKNYNEYVAFKNGVIEEGKKETGIIINIEGGHCLFEFKSYAHLIEINPAKDQDQTDVEIIEYKRQLEENIYTLKRLGPNAGHSPLYITLSHHFWNLLAGYAPSLPDFLRYKQKKGFHQKFKYLGKAALELLLKRESDARRILIDIKHLSNEAKDEFFELIKAKRIEGDNIPIIASHAAVQAEFEASKKKWFYCNDEINLRDKDIELIVETEGLIGIMMEQGRIASKDIIRYINKKVVDDMKPTMQAEMIIAQMLYIVKVCGYQAWDHICIGSDFDGMINSPSHIPNATKLQVIFDTLKDIMDKKRSILDVKKVVFPFCSQQRVLFTWEEIEPLLHQQSYEEIAEKISIRNVECFLEKFFHDGYLKG